MIEALFTICGRGGSTGVKNKNIRELCGIPLIAWSIFDAENAFENNKEINKTIAIDSDSEIILRMAKTLCPKALLHKRRNELAGDRISKMDVIKEVLIDISQLTNVRFDLVIDLDITSPLRTNVDIESACKILLESNYEAVFSVVPSRRNPYFNMIEMNNSGRYFLSKYSNFVARQEAPRVYDMNASIYVYKPHVFLGNSKSPVLLNFGIYEMHDYGVIDVDTEYDLALMELILTHGVHLLPDRLIKKIEKLSNKVKKHESKIS